MNGASVFEQYEMMWLKWLSWNMLQDQHHYSSSWNITYRKNYY